MAKPKRETDHTWATDLASSVLAVRAVGDKVRPTGASRGGGQYVSAEGTAPDQQTAVAPLRVARRWCHQSRWYASWSPARRGRLRRTQVALQGELAGRLHHCCAHLKGHGGVKGTLRRLTRCAPAFRFVARFDVARYYESMVHAVLLNLLQSRGASPQSLAVVRQYLQLPDGKRTGVGMTAGGCLSPCLGAVMLTPLDEVMQQLVRETGIYYVRYWTTS